MKLSLCFSKSLELRINFLFGRVGWNDDGWKGDDPTDPGALIFYYFIFTGPSLLVIGELILTIFWTHEKRLNQIWDEIVSHFNQGGFVSILTFATIPRSYNRVSCNLLIALNN